MKTLVLAFLAGVTVFRWLLLPSQGPRWDDHSKEENKQCKLQGAGSGAGSSREQLGA